MQLLALVVVAVGGKTKGVHSNVLVCALLHKTTLAEVALKSSEILVLSLFYVSLQLLLHCKKVMGNNFPRKPKGTHSSL